MVGDALIDMPSEYVCHVARSFCEVREICNLTWHADKGALRALSQTCF